MQILTQTNISAECRSGVTNYAHYLARNFAGTCYQGCGAVTASTRTFSAAFRFFLSQTVLSHGYLNFYLPWLEQVPVLSYVDWCNMTFLYKISFKSLIPARTPAPQHCLQQVRKAGEADLKYPALHPCEEADPQGDGGRTLQDLQPLLLHHLNKRQFTASHGGS